MEHRLLSLGGNQALLSIPPGLAVGNQLVVSAAKFRYQILRGVDSTSDCLADGCQWSLGLEGGHLQSQCTLPTPCSWSALGFRSGLSFVGDVFGVRPSMLGIWFDNPYGSTPWKQTPLHAMGAAPHPTFKAFVQARLIPSWHPPAAPVPTPSHRVEAVSGP